MPATHKPNGIVRTTTLRFKETILLVSLAGGILACDQVPGARRNNTEFVPASTEALAEVAIVPLTPMPSGALLATANVDVTPVRSQRPIVDGSDSAIIVMDPRFGRAVIIMPAQDTSSVIQLSYPLKDISTPRGVARVGSDLWILDGNRRLIRYLLSPSGIAFKQAVPLNHRADGVCALDGKLFVRGRGQDELLVHVYGGDGVFLNAFADAIDAQESLFRDQLSRGGIVCDKVNEALIITFDVLPEVRAYSVDGTLRWQKRLGEITSIDARAGWDPDPYVSRSFDSEWDEIWGLVPVVADTIELVGVTRHAGSENDIVTIPWRLPLLIRDGITGVKVQVESIELARAKFGRLNYKSDGEQSLLLTLERRVK